MKVGIYFNKKYFSDSNYYVEKVFDAFSKEDCKVVATCDDLAGIDVLFVLGGDGTILSIASECAKRKVRIIGINYGHLGFLAEVEPDKFDKAVELVKNGNFTVQKRSMLKIECRDKIYYALNDLVIQRSTNGINFCNTVNLHAEIDGATVDNFSSDGIIISTPTGSTAYSLAAGGSVLTPDIEAFILTPICPHSLHSRPVVYSDRSVLTISPMDSSAPLGLVIDGKVVGTVNSGEIISVKKAEYTVDFITKDDKNFFNKLLIKLNIWSK